MKIQVLEIQIGDRIVAYCNNKRQACTVKQILDSGQGSITLTVSTSEHYRGLVPRVVRFQREALVDLAS
jgi:hypothetical protein